MTLLVRSLKLLCALVLGVACLSGCKKRPDANSTGPIVIGAYLSMSGSMATFGESSKRGAEIAVDEANAHGGLLGRKVQLVVVDDQGKAEEVGNAVLRLID